MKEVESSLVAHHKNRSEHSPEGRVNSSMSHFRVFSNVVKEVGGGRARKRGVRSV